MQPRKQLSTWLEQHSSPDRYLFSVGDLRNLFLNLSNLAFKTLISRSASSGLLCKVCRGLYAYKKVGHADGLLLFHAAAYLRSNQFNYISLETVLSEAGVISQIPMNWISVMSSGRSNKISCGKFGTIEFVHTSQKPNEVMKNLSYDNKARLWKANVAQALKDMKATRRNCDLINWDIANELLR